MRSYKGRMKTMAQLLVAGSIDDLAVADGAQNNNGDVCCSPTMLVGLKEDELDLMNTDTREHKGIWCRNNAAFSNIDWNIYKQRVVS